ncbi:glycosyltransferase [Podospora fimiseda]|uniref:Glycosyltransferase n=1 Tax=Podospora fimiseda TaxID=252190 RepID=A0AAN6YMN4_9PEZI|nr:glycosyltransferase [Podospora fimiseda]
MGPPPPNSSSLSRFTRRTRFRRAFLPFLVSLFLLSGFAARFLLYDLYTLASLPITWSQHAETFYISPSRDDFDLTFQNYSLPQLDALPPYENKVPAILHHISLGNRAVTNSKWIEVRQSCLDIHTDWKAYLWTDETADLFVREEFPELYEMWTEGYKYPIQRIDALRYMVLFKYGGVILDMDLQCKRGLGPLRRFEFVAPAAHPTGFSIGFMMAAERNSFVGELVQGLKRYNRGWLGLPYTTVMFSTGCHYASTIHAFQKDRTELKILSGTRENPGMHSLNGPVSTPIFNHLGSSSWHSYDAALIVSIGKGHAGGLPLMLIFGSLVSFFLIKRIRRGRLLK